MQHQLERRQLAAALRWAARLGWQTGICNHFSLAVDADGDAPDGILINPQGYQWSEVTASSLLLMDDSGRVAAGEGDVEATAFHIHRAVHLRVPAARAVLHTHTPYATAIMCTEKGRILNCHQESLIFHRRIAYDDAFGGIAAHEAEGERIARALGDKSIMLMAHHGVIVTGPDMARAFDDFYYLESVARFQVLALSTGAPLKVMSDADADELSPPFQDTGQAAGHFESILRILDRTQPDYRD